MRNRRFTIFVVIALALVSTPKVWQKFNGLLAAVRHHAQSKLLNMALSSQAQEYGETVLAPIGQTEYMAASCPNSQVNQVAEAANNRSPVRQFKARSRAASISSAEHATLAFSIKPETTGHEPLPVDSDTLLAGTSENLLKMHGVTSVPPQLARGKSDIVEVVMLPRIDQFAPVTFEKDPNLNIKVRKVLEETKVLRQKARFVMGKTGSWTVPSS